MRKIIVLSGGPGTGKTSVINELAKEFRILPEAAREISNGPRFRGKSIKELDQVAFQEAIFQLQKRQLESAPENEIIFSDRGIGDAIAYGKIHGIGAPRGALEFARNFRYFKVFILDPLKTYEQDSLRMENREESLKIHRAIEYAYQELKYETITVPVASIKARADFIKDRV